MYDTEQLQERIDALAAKADTLVSQLANTRSTSKAHLIGSLGPDTAGDEYNFFAAVAQARSRDHDEQMAGKAKLEEMGSRFAEAKATVGDTDANGGYILPNNLVGSVIEAATARNPIRRLLNVITGVRTASVDLPTEGAAPARAVVALPGMTKENVNFTVNNYTATLYTLARIFDVGNQFLRHSQGAAEQLVRSKLARAFALGELYYVLSGSGTNEPKGILTTIGTSGDFYTGHTATDNTLAGSLIAGLTKGVEALADRGREADGILVNSGDWAHAQLQGSDTAGPWVASGALAALPPIVTTAGIASGTAIVGEWKSAELYIGDEYRVDVSSEAGDRWDKNLTGFRGEEEIAFNGEAYVQAGMFQRIGALVP